MQQQTIPSSDAEVTNGHARTSGSSDPFVDSAMDALTDLGKQPANDNAEPPRARRRAPDEQRPEPEGPGAEEGDEGEEEPVPGGEPPEEDEGEAAQETDGEDEEAHDTRGSKEEPFTVKDLPADKFIELKVDGEKKVVSLAELASGYIGQQTINQRLNQTKKLTDEAQALAAKAKEERTTVKRALSEFLKDPDQLFEYFNDTADREKILEAVAVKYAEQVTRFRKNPEERLRFERARDEARLAWERQQWEQQVQAEAHAKQQAEMQQRAESIFRPGWEQGLKRAGFPQPTKELYEEVLVRCNQRAASGAEVTTDDVAEFTYRACKLLELKPKGAQKPRPAPAPAPREAAPRRNGKDPWKDKPARERVKDNDYFLKNLRSRDFRL
jgi:ribosomal protein L17